MSDLLKKWRDLTLVRPIELGGMCDIYVALTPAHDRVVLRRLKKSYLRNRRIRKQFVHGIEILNQLTHPSIIEFIDGGYDEDNVPYLILKYFESHSLRKCIHEHDPLLTSHLMLILIQLAEGIEYIHRAGFFHFDLKPDNILVNEYGDLRIIDFDLACERKKKPIKIRELSGTPAYIAPEVLQFKRVDETTDIFSFGVIAFEILTGSKPPPPDASSSSRMETMLLKEQVSPALARIVFKCLDPKPPSRYPAMVLVLNDLKKIV